jgi:hypothetical protein
VPFVFSFNVLITRFTLIVAMLSAKTSVMNCFPSLCAEEQLDLQDPADTQGKLVCLYNSEFPLLTASASLFMCIVINLLYLQTVLVNLYIVRNSL